MEPTEVADLVARCIHGDDSARAEFIAAFDDIIRRSVARKLSSSAESREFQSDRDDICNEIYLRLFRNNCAALAKIREPRSIHAWLMTVSQNHVYTYLRKRQAHVSMRASMAKESIAPYDEGPEEEVVKQETLAIVQQGLASLDAKDRLILQLFYLHNLKYAEIAETLSLNINTVASRMMRAKEKLRKQLAEDFS